MADAQRAFRSPRSPSPACETSPSYHPARALGDPDSDGFFTVRSRRIDRRRSPPRTSRPVPPALVGLCFNCLASTHVKADCHYPSRCYNCWGEGHRAAACTLPARHDLGAAYKRARSPLDPNEGRRVSRRRAYDDHHSRGSVDTVSGGSASTGRSTSVPRCCAPPTPPPPLPPPLPQPADAAVENAVAVPEDLPNGVSIPDGTTIVHDWPGGPHLSPIIVVPRTAELQRAEDDLGLAMVVLVGGTRPAVSTAMVSAYLFERFGITSLDADVRRHDPEDFVIRFRHREDRERVLAARPTGAPLPLLWRPWRRTSWASAGTFRFRVLVAMRRLPLHARSAAVAQAILGPCCTNIELTRPRDIPDDDDTEFFITAWCWHPRFIREEQIIFIPEPPIPGAC